MIRGGVTIIMMNRRMMCCVYIYKKKQIRMIITLNRYILFATGKSKKLKNHQCDDVETISDWQMSSKKKARRKCDDVRVSTIIYVV
jgi:hypothetical protein